jgi:hypothetical protein
VLARHRGRLYGRPLTVALLLLLLQEQAMRVRQYLHVFTSKASTFVPAKHDALDCSILRRITAVSALTLPASYRSGALWRSA